MIVNTATYRSLIFPSHISSRGYKIGLVCLSICLLTLSQLICLASFESKFCLATDLDNINFIPSIADAGGNNTINWYIGLWVPCWSVNASVSLPGHSHTIIEYFVYDKHCTCEKPFSSFVVMEVILMEGFLLFSSFVGKQTDGGKSDGLRKKWWRKSWWRIKLMEDNLIPNRISSINWGEQKFLHHFGLHQDFCHQIKKRCTGACNMYENWKHVKSILQFLKCLMKPKFFFIFSLFWFINKYTFYIVQGSQRPGKSWKTWKMKKPFSRPGKSWNLKKNAKIMEKSWNFKILIWKNHGKKILRCTRIIQWWFNIQDVTISIVKLVLFVSFLVEKVWLEGVMWRPHKKSYTTNHNSCFLCRVDHGKPWKDHEKSWNLILGNCWEPWLGNNDVSVGLKWSVDCQADNLECGCWATLIFVWMSVSHGKKGSVSSGGNSSFMGPIRALSWPP